MKKNVKKATAIKSRKRSNLLFDGDEFSILAMQPNDQELSHAPVTPANPKPAAKTDQRNRRWLQ